MIALTIAFTVAVITVAGWFIGGGMFSQTAGRGCAVVLLGCSLLSLVSGLLWPFIVLIIFAALMAFMSYCAGEN